MCEHVPANNKTQKKERKEDTMTSAIIMMRYAVIIHKAIQEQEVGKPPTFWFTLANFIGAESLEDVIVVFDWYVIETVKAKKEFAFRYQVTDESVTVMLPKEPRGSTLFHALARLLFQNDVSEVPTTVFYLMHAHCLSPKQKNAAGHSLLDVLPNKSQLYSIEKRKRSSKGGTLINIYHRKYYSLREEVELFYYLLFLLPIIWRQDEKLNGLNLSSNKSLTRRVMKFFFLSDVFLKI